MSRLKMSRVISCLMVLLLENLCVLYISAIKYLNIPQQPKQNNIN